MTVSVLPSLLRCSLIISGKPSIDGGLLISSDLT